MKICSICKEEKALSEYYSYNKTKADGTPYIYHHPECKECARNKASIWSKENIDKVRKSKRDWANKNRDLVNKHTEKSKKDGKYREWQRNNKDKIREYNKKREMNKKHEITKDEWENCKNYFNYRCAHCGLPVEEHYKMWKGELKQFDLHKEHVDHEGSNDLSNCIPSCQSCNSSKYYYTLEEWYNENNPSFTMKRLNKIHKWLNQDYKKYILSK